MLFLISVERTKKALILFVMLSFINPSSVSAKPCSGSLASSNFDKQLMNLNVLYMLMFNIYSTSHEEKHHDPPINFALLNFCLIKLEKQSSNSTSYCSIAKGNQLIHYFNFL